MNHHNVHPTNHHHQQGSTLYCELPYQNQHQQHHHQQHPQHQSTSQSMGVAAESGSLQEQRLAVSQGFLDQSESVSCGPPMSSYQGHQVYNQCQHPQQQQQQQQQQQHHQLSALNNQQLYMTHQYQLNDVTSYSDPQGSIHHQNPHPHHHPHPHQQQHQQHQTLPLDSQQAYESQIHFIPPPPLAGIHQQSTENQYDDSSIHISRPSATDQLFTDYSNYNSLLMDPSQQDHHHHHQHPNQYPRMVHYQSQQPNMITTHQANSFPNEMLDQSQSYSQNQMDLYPTIKQQQQQQQQQQHQQQQLHQQPHQHQQHHSIGVASAAPPVETAPVVRVRPYEQMINVYANRNLDTTSNVVADIISQRPKPERELSTLKVPYAVTNNQSGRENRVQRVVPPPPPQAPQQRHTSASLSNQQKHQETSATMQLQQTTNDHQSQQQSSQQQRQENFLDVRSAGSVHQDWLDTICRHLIEHLDRFGICVIDNFLGSLRGDSILKEVKQLYSSGRYVRGKLVGNKLANRTLGSDTGVIRNDRVIWIDGFEDGCSEINNLIQTLCSVITNSARLSLYSNNGLDKMVINKRTKAHVACYPGNGTRYIKHVDNPNGDGRVITSIYYLNKDWITKRDGGLLRMFPVGINEVANIEPLFDRVLFFWSDRRNPHEVLPAYKDRFAITVWYIGESRS